MAKIVLISGKAQHGKDTSATYLRAKLEAQGKKVLICHFADYLKYVLTTYYNWDGKKDEAGRTLLQDKSLLIKQKTPNFWGETLANLIWAVQEDFDYILIPDWRYRAEYYTMCARAMQDSSYSKIFISDRVMTLRVIRRASKISSENYDNKLTITQKIDISETDLDQFDFDGFVCAYSLEDLYSELDFFYDSYLKE